MTKTSKRSMRMALALMLSASAGALTIATPAVAQSQGDFTRYANSGYNYCDAKLIGAIYNQDAYQGKILIGTKIRNGIGSNIPLMLNESRSKGNRCDWRDVPHSYEDAVKLGDYWGVGTSGAKAKVASFYTNGQAGAVTDALRRFDSERANNDAAITRFFASGFNYCDAKMVGAYLGGTAYQGKILIGNKIGSGLIENVPWYIDQARSNGSKCTWGEVNYDYDDAERLAQMWSKSVGATKTAIANLVTMGRSDVIDGSLGR